MVDRQTAGVGTSAAFCHCGRVFHVLDLVDGEHGRTLAVPISLAGDQGCSESSHDTCDIRADRFAVRDLFEASEHGVVVERTALYDDMVPKL